jgi:hypothetical protein
VEGSVPNDQEVSRLALMPLNQNIFERVNKKINDNY